MAVPIRSVKFWINAFIPRDIPGYTKPVPGGPHRGKTMIPGPNRFSDCYLTDQRGFSADIHAKSRMHAEARVSFASTPPLLTQWHNCDFTTECDCEDGDEECHKQGSTSRMGFKMLPTPARIPPARSAPGTLLPNKNPGGPQAAGQLVRLSMECAASNPCAPTSRLFGDIDFVGTIEIDTERRSIEFDGMIDQFPAFEAYATINDGAGVMMFQANPPSGNTVMNLPGKANRPIRRLLKDTDGDGVFDRLL